MIAKVKERIWEIVGHLILTMFILDCFLCAFSAMYSAFHGYYGTCIVTYLLFIISTIGTVLFEWFLEIEAIEKKMSRVFE